MEDFTHRAVSRAQRKYGINPATAGVPRDSFEGPENPLAHKASTFGSVQQRTAWRTPSGASLSAQSRKSTLFDEDATNVSQISRDK